MLEHPNYLGVKDMKSGAEAVWAIIESVFLTPRPQLEPASGEDKAERIKSERRSDRSVSSALSMDWARVIQRSIYRKEEVCRE